MKRVKVEIALVLIALALGVVVAGCGGSSSSSTGSSDGATSADATAPADGGPSPNNEAVIAEFGKGETTEFGTEAEPQEVEQASAVLEENLEARAAGDYAGQCATLARSVVKRLEQAQPAVGSKGCPGTLEVEAQGAPAYILENTLTPPLEFLLVEGKEGFAIWHGTDGGDYAMPMEKEGSEWKVASVTTIPLRPPTGAEAKPPAGGQGQPQQGG